MKITKSFLKQLIKEELEAVLSEYEGLPGDVFRFDDEGEDPYPSDDPYAGLSDEERFRLRKRKEKEDAIRRGEYLEKPDWEKRQDEDEEQWQRIARRGG
jgi:hypothetical protein